MDGRDRDGGWWDEPVLEGTWYNRLVAAVVGVAVATTLWTLAGPATVLLLAGLISVWVGRRG
ncbi:hypothetical protein Tmar_2132 [Thermaerobacter marianensis DSM 12885]|uniref:Uncharacterized protein n=1 Tax=Thermaerobacter marianensis (strain ATCC 700841 / DSM 12885 / JCM 10246 / 7p75a) TaxID=644966 RepID=E6SJY0_THEM7|nr:hypothetical protein [Thermaerobacter marianensis]ADU52213.1 hypothetical protein Tmar_2132 [Thermaerobacter marianensis DSM 12885]